MEALDACKKPGLPENPRWIFNFEEGIVECGKRKFQVREVTAEEIKYFRKHHISSIIIKMESKLYIGNINKNKPITSTRSHMCCDKDHDCLHMYAVASSDKGCAKVISFSTGIENFDFITSGYETFGTIKDALIVWSCSLYKKEPPRKPKESIQSLLKSL